MVPARVLTARVLARPGTPFEEDVPVGQQADQQPLQQAPLTHDHPVHFGEDLGSLVSLVRGSGGGPARGLEEVGDRTGLRWRIH